MSAALATMGDLFARHQARLADARQADALAARIARLAAMPMGKGE